MRKDFGFTLIELLVVIAIIGVLATIAISVASSATAKSYDSSIRSNLKSINNFAAMYYETYSNYGTATNYGSPNCQDPFFVSLPIVNFITDSEKKSKNNAVCVLGDTSGQNGSANSWAISVPLRTNPLKSWCVDGDGFSNVANASYDGITDKAFCSTS